MSMPKAGIRLRGKQPVKTTTQSLPVHHSKSKVRAATHLDGPIGADAPVPASAATMPELSPPNGNVVALVRCELRAKKLEDLLVVIFGEPTYFRILAVALSWLERCSCASALPVKVCAAALLLTGINFETTTKAKTLSTAKLMVQDVVTRALLENGRCALRLCMVSACHLHTAALLQAKHPWHVTGQVAWNS